MPAHPRLAAVLAVALACACARTRRYEDLGRACLGDADPWDTGAEVSIPGGDATPVTAVLSECASGSTRWLDQTCTATVEGDRITVTTTGKTKTPRTITADCNTIAMPCGTVEIPAGDYTLVYGAAEQTFTVPYDGVAICAGNANG